MQHGLSIQFALSLEFLDDDIVFVVGFRLEYNVVWSIEMYLIASSDWVLEFLRQKII